MTEASRAEHFGRIIQPELDVLHRVARSLTGHEHDAQDLVQEAALRAWRSLDSFDDRHPRAWLLTIMRHASINQHRRRRPMLALDPAAFAERLGEAIAPDDPASEVVARLDARRVAAAVARLPPPFRDSVALVDLDDASYAEASRRLGVPEGTVMSRVSRGRDRLRRELSACR